MSTEFKQLIHDLMLKIHRRMVATFCPVCGRKTDPAHDEFLGVQETQFPEIVVSLYNCTCKSTYAVERKIA